MSVANLPNYFSHSSTGSLPLSKEKRLLTIVHCQDACVLRSNQGKVHSENARKSADPKLEREKVAKKQQNFPDKNGGKMANLLENRSFWSVPERRFPSGSFIRWRWRPFSPGRYVTVTIDPGADQWRKTASQRKIDWRRSELKWLFHEIRSSLGRKLRLGLVFLCLRFVCYDVLNKCSGKYCSAIS